MLPRVILHNAVSSDGRVDGFVPDIGLFYQLVGRWHEDATLAGSDTLLSHPEESVEEGAAAESANEGEDVRPLLVVPDSRGRIRNWDYWQRQPYWRAAVVLCCANSPRDYLQSLDSSGVQYIVAGEQRVDFEAALQQLCDRHQVRTVRVDSGGTLNGVLLRAGLVHEVSLLVHPCLVGGNSPKSMFRADDLASVEGVIGLRLMHLEQLPGDVVWLIYEVTLRKKKRASR